MSYRKKMIIVIIILQEITLNIMAMQSAENLENLFNACPICLEEFDDQHTTQQLLVKTPCQHIFHVRCIRKWLNFNPSCPACRRELQHSKLTPFPPLTIELQQEEYLNNTEATLLKLQNMGIATLQLKAAFNTINQLESAIERLQILNLSNNTITELPIGIFDCFTHLKKLDLSHNQLTGLNALVFGYLDAIEFINLWHNPLVTFQQQCFMLPKQGICEIDLGRNRRLKTIAYETLQELAQNFKKIRLPYQLNDAYQDQIQALQTMAKKQ